MMDANWGKQHRSLEGRRVGVALTGGTRLDDCQLVSAGRGGKLWLFDNGCDVFVSLADVIAVWEVEPLLSAVRR
jgi:hypothetical protein